MLRAASLVADVSRSPVARYGLALGLGALGWGLRAWLFPAQGLAGLLLFFPLVLLAFGALGIGPGGVVTLLGVASAGLVLGPAWRWSMDDALWVATAVFSLAGVGAGLGLHHSRLAFARLRARYLDLKALLDEQTDLVCRHRADDLVLLDVNAAFCRCFDVHRREVLGRPWSLWLGPDAAGARAQDLAALRGLSRQQPTLTTERQVRDPAGGPPRWVQFIHRGVFDAEGKLTEVQSVGRDLTDHKRLESELEAAVDQTRDLYDNAPCGYYSLDARGVFIRVNPVMLGWLGCDAPTVLGRLSPTDFFTDEGRQQFNLSFPTFVRTCHSLGPLEFDLQSRHGATRRVSMSATVVRDAEGRYARSRSVMYDISELHRVRLQLRQLLREQEAVIDNDLVGAIRLRDRCELWHNRAISRIFGYGPGELRRVSSSIFYADEASFLALGEQAYPTLAQGGTYRAQLQMRKKSGEPLWIDLSGVALDADARETLWLMLDVSDMKRQQEAMEAMAFNDNLTGLPNRLLLADRLNQALALADRRGHRVAVGYLDLDGFKPINDQHGHRAGDLLLREVARRLRACVRSNDTVARVGGDEFVLLFTSVDQPSELTQALDRVLDALAQPMRIGGALSVHIGASIGVALYPEDASEPGLLLHLADLAMYEAKRAGHGRYQFYEARQPPPDTEPMDLEA